MNATSPTSLTGAAVAVINEPTPEGKIAQSRLHADAWQAGTLSTIGDVSPPDRPARPPKPELLAPRLMPRRSKGGEAGRFAFVHAIAHIEFNAIDLAWDIVARFTDEAMPTAFYNDWVGVAADEARHFELLCGRLDDLGGAYGDLPGHDGLWEASSATSDDLLARLALVPMVLEARGLDTTPAAVARFRRTGDDATADLLEFIGTEEIPHVAAGVRWFEFLARQRGLEPIAAFHEIIETRFGGNLKPPFNSQARDAAGMAPAYYQLYADAADS